MNEDGASDIHAVPSSALDAVRRATAQSHRRLEALPAQARLLRHDFTRSEYRAVLERLYGFYDPLAQSLGANTYADAWRTRIAERADLLACDLRDLGLSADDLGRLSRCEQLPPVDSPDRALGCAYMLEGATLGGRVIFKHLGRVFPNRTEVPLRFFAGDGDQTATCWRRFCACLNAQTKNVDELCAAACAAFDAMSAWLGEPLTV